jgi:uncharacterized protein YndB with AHSA1/START domain
MTATQQRSVVLTRILDAPPRLVYAAWTQPQHLGWFLNPDNPSDAPIEVDLRVGGTWRLEMVINDDLRYFTGGVYRELVPDERIVFTFGAVGGWPELDGAAADDAPVVAVTLRELAGSTEMTLQMDFPSHLSDEDVKQWLDLGMEDGWRQTIDRFVPASV